MEAYRKIILMGILIIALGVVFSTTLADSIGSIGTVFIAVGGLFFIIGMKKKRDSDEAEE
jgi:hypothetical protein